MKISGLKFMKYNRPKNRYLLLPHPELLPAKGGLILSELINYQSHY
jgi:hypothetical protein